MKVRDFASRICESKACDRELLEIFSLLHDIVKVYKANEEYLRKNHGKLGYEASKDPLPQLDLNKDRLDKLTKFLKGELESIETAIVKDADIIAFLSDERLQAVFKEWTESKYLREELQRKADKINILKFEESKQIAKPFWLQMKDRFHLK